MAPSFPSMGPPIASISLTGVQVIPPLLLIEIRIFKEIAVGVISTIAYRFVFILDELFFPRKRVNETYRRMIRGC